ncbi:MAG: carbohydrate ABC transporter permease [Chloroflexi bacterium]|nr:MAG: carbohydrate ABC transporter permease [Chloroflexota bacterium]
MDFVHHRAAAHCADFPIIGSVGLLRRPVEGTLIMNKIMDTLRWLLGSSKGHDFLLKGLTTLILAAGSVLVIIPFMYMISTSLKDPAQIRSDSFSLIPRKPQTTEINGEKFNLYEVNIEGQKKTMALLKKSPGGMGNFADPANPARVYELKIEPQVMLYRFDIHWENYPDALTAMPFLRYLGNTLIVTFVGMFGMLFSCSLVAYGFSRFRARWLNLLFLLLLSTIMLPSQVRLIPVYILFNKLGWVDTLLPLIVPQFFANAYDVFLLRQFFMTVPLELDDAAKIDGANPLQILLYIMLPQARPAVISVAIFHFMYAWNDFYEPLIFLHSRENWTLAVGLQTFDAIYTINTHLIMAVSLLMIVPPILLFFFSQKIFTQGVVFTGVKG